MLRRRQINSGAALPRLRPRVGPADVLRGMLDAVEWPFERLAWTLERRIVWPLGERLGLAGEPKRAAGIAALALAIAGIVAFGIVSASGGRRAPVEPLGIRTAAPLAAPAAKHAAPAAPVLHGVAPSFAPQASVSKAAQAGGAKAAAKAASAASAATANALPPATPGPAAIRVAHHFADAFVLFETGSVTPAVRAAFAETATPKLARELLHRPPRLPANAKIPQAKVVNVVPGPRVGKVYTVSVSLLRLGLTSELRLSVQYQGGGAPSGGGTAGGGTGAPGETGGWRVVGILG